MEKTLDGIPYVGVTTLASEREETNALRALRYARIPYRFYSDNGVVWVMVKLAAQTEAIHAIGVGLAAPLHEAPRWRKR